MKGSITPVIPKGAPIRFEYNPPELESSKDVTWAEIAIPGLDFPLQQFVRGGLRTLTVEVYLNSDNYDKVYDVREAVRKLEAFVEKTEDTLAPPVCLFEWGGLLATVVVGAVSTRYTMFDTDGAPIEASVGLTLRYLREATVQPEPAVRQAEKKRTKRSPVYSGKNGSGSVVAPKEEDGVKAAQELAKKGIPKVYLTRKRDPLPAVSSREYGTPGLWRAIAIANKGFDKVRDIREGVEALIPDPRFPLAIIERTSALPPDAIELLRKSQKAGTGAML